MVPLPRPPREVTVGVAASAPQRPDAPGGSVGLEVERVDTDVVRIEVALVVVAARVQA